LGKIIKAICTVALALAVIAIGIYFIASSTILEKTYITSKMEDTNYYGNTYAQIKLDFENYIYQSGLDENVIANLVTIEDVKNDTDIVLSNIYDGLNAPIDTSKLKENLIKNIDASLEGKNISSDAEKAIQDFTKQIEEQYKDSILHTKYETKINSGYSKIKKLLNTAKNVLIIIIVITTILIFLSNKKEGLKNIKYIGISLSSAGIFYIFLNIFIWARIKIENIRILSDAITLTIRYIIKDVLNTINIYGTMFLILGIILIFIGNINKQKNKT